MTLQKAQKRIQGCLATLFLAASMATPAIAQRAETVVDIFNGGAGAGATADGQLKFARSKSSSNNGVQFGHGFAVGAGPNGIAVSNSIGAGTGPVGAAHNLNLTIGRGGTHVSQGGVVSQGGNRRVTTGGSTGIQNGQVYGGSNSTGYGNNTRAWSQSHTNQWSQPSVQTPQVYPQSSIRMQGQGGLNRSVNHRWGHR